MCVLSLTHVACLMPVNHSHERSKASPQMAAGSGPCCCLVCCGFCQNYKCDPERDLPATSLLKKGCVGTALGELLPKSLLCLVVMPHNDKTQLNFFFLLIVLRAPELFFLKNKTSSLSLQSFSQSVFLQGKGISSVSSVHGIAINILGFDSSHLRKILHGRGGRQDTVLPQSCVPVSLEKQSLCV